MRKLSSSRPVWACITVVMLFAFTPAASAKWVIKGHGFGHGIGMSQYGAYGYAQHGRNYKQILGHYYKHTKVEKVKPRKIKVLLTSGVGAVSFSGAKKACGRSLSKSKAYSFAGSGSRVILQNSAGHKLSSCGGTGSTGGGRAITISGHKYRGGLVATLVSGSLYVINKVGLEDYVQGVVPNEMPASWAQQALRVQAVAARSYALATKSGSSVFDVYDDTRSQVYGGLESEQAASNLATRKTAGKVVTYHGKVATTYFFSTSGGHTENIEDSFVGSSPVPYLKGVKDRYDGISPDHKWKVPLTRSTIASQLSGLFSGRLKKIHVLRRGASPRIVYARVVGSAGSTKVTGPTLKARLNLMDSWLNFGKHQTGVPAGGGSGGGSHHHRGRHHHGGGRHHGGPGAGSGGVGPGGKAPAIPSELRALVQTGPAVQPRPGDMPAVP